MSWKIFFLFKDVQMILLWFFDIPTFFRLRNELFESAIQVLSNPWTEWAFSLVLYCQSTQSAKPWLKVLNCPHHNLVIVLCLNFLFVFLKLVNLLISFIIAICPLMIEFLLSACPLIYHSLHASPFPLCEIFVSNVLKMRPYSAPIFLCLILDISGLADYQQPEIISVWFANRNYSGLESELIFIIRF